MIVLDTSAVIALMGGEQDAPAIAAALAADRDRRISAATLVETAHVASRWGDQAATTRMNALMAALGVQVEALDAEQTAIARQAFLRFGKGRGHPAQLNLGDCFAYALAKSLNAALLFKGEDFAKTDIKRAIES